MNTYKFGIGIALSISLFLSASCTSDEPDSYMPSDSNNGTHTCYMYLDKESLTGFETTRSGDSDTWSTGDVIYIQFMYTLDAVTKYVTGNAVYNSGIDAWTLTYNGYIPGEGVCEMYFFVPSKAVSSTVSIDENTIVYEDVDATYRKNSKGDVVVHARLKPKTGRVRFSGDANTQLWVSGLTCLSEYDVQSNQFSSTSKWIPLTVDQNGYTPYLYVTSETKSLHIELSDVTRNLYTKDFSGIPQPGKSGVVRIPDSFNYTGWTRSPLSETFTVKGITFKMMYVGSGTFLMGATEEQQNPSQDEFPVHRVTLTKNYYMGETVVTQELWEAVMGNNPSKTVGNNKPVTAVNYTQYLDFIGELNKVTGQNFRLPTEAEWEYAARGGCKAENFQYSGGANINDYACYGVSTLPDVKTKNPNALGIYDMSGLVWELCQDEYAGYSSGDKTDPVYGGGYVTPNLLRGGCYKSAAKYCRTSARYIWSHVSDDLCGFRLVF
ncbi:MAG: formylglycine-generating enzyme family protein [Prevotellaceae bacterium]|nr:formylglycine-generating enzyme family protein [Prevotellaceae bacterium]